MDENGNSTAWDLKESYHAIWVGEGYEKNESKRFNICGGDFSCVENPILAKKYILRKGENGCVYESGNFGSQS